MCAIMSKSQSLMMWYMHDEECGELETCKCSKKKFFLCFIDVEELIRTVEGKVYFAIMMFLGNGEFDIRQMRLILFCVSISK